MKNVLIYTDGSCLGNPGPGGWAAILQLVGTPHSKEIFGGFRLTTNNRMEITAALEALCLLKEPCLVDLYSDSQYLCNSIQKGWIYGWRNKGWLRKDGKPVPNTDLWLRLLPLLGTHKITFHWLRGHDGHPENERCDELARACAAKPSLPIDEQFETGRADQFNL